MLHIQPSTAQWGKMPNVQAGSEISKKQESKYIGCNPNAHNIISQDYWLCSYWISNQKLIVPSSHTKYRYQYEFKDK